VTRLGKLLVSWSQLVKEVKLTLNDIISQKVSDRD
jgi:hypothetical protein